MLSTEFEAATPAIKQLQTYALDRRVTRIGKETLLFVPKYNSCFILLRYLVSFQNKQEG